MKRALKFLIYIVLFLFFLPFIISPYYNFPEPLPFSGDKIWNPYQGIDNANWKKGNFQVQSRAWGGITDGSNNTFEKVWHRYHELNYDIIGISDYQKINTLAKDSSGYIPIYEHGYNFSKTHQVNLGAKNVLWLDFPFYQNVHHKQFLINLQRHKTELLAIVHPAFSLEGYSHSNLQKLTNYDLLEALNMQIFSISHWDAALSAGRRAYIIANDDVHNIDDAFWYGRVATIINSPSNSQKDILKSLKEGKAYGITPYTPDFDTHEKKVARVQSLPYLKTVEVIGKRLIISADSTVKSFRFYGQDGQLKKTVENLDSAYYDFKSDDSYIRTEIDYGGDQILYLNPVFRYSGEHPKTIEPAKINWYKTLILNALALILFILIIIVIKKKWN